MPASPRSLADALRRWDDARLRALLEARSDLLSPPPLTLSALAARAASPASVRSALLALDAAQLTVLDAAIALSDPLSPTVPVRAADLAARLGAPIEALAPVLDQLLVRALVWDADAADAEAPRPDRPSAIQIVRTVRELRPALTARGSAGAPPAAGIPDPAPAPDHAGAPGTPDAPTRFAPSPPPLGGEEQAERFPGARTAGAVEHALESVRVLRTILDWGEDAPGVLRRGGLPQREQRRLAAGAGSDPLDYLTILQAGWTQGLLVDDGEEWAPSTEWTDVLAESEETLWAELVLGWAGSDHLASLAGTPDATGQPRAGLSEATRRAGASDRRIRMLRLLSKEGGGRDIAPASLLAALAWRHPLLPPALLAQEIAALRAEGRAWGILDGGALTVLGEELVAALPPVSAQGTPQDDPRSAQPREHALSRTLAELAPEPVDEVLLGADLTIIVPGRPSARLQELTAWTEVVSRGGGLTLRLTAASVRGALAAGRDGEELLDLLLAASRTPLPQALEYLVRDEMRRSGQVRLGAAASWLSGEEDAIAALLAHQDALVSGLQRIAPTALVSSLPPRALQRLALKAGLTPRAVAVGGVPGASAGRRGGGSGGGAPVQHHSGQAPTPQGPTRAEEAVRALRAGEAGERPLSTVDRLLQAADGGWPIAIGIVDGRGGLERRTVRITAVEDGRAHALDAESGERISVLLHRLTLDLPA